jgi:exopolysaccharide biosynthesis polyprenyl glycosylphosphotransferase
MEPTDQRTGSGTPDSLDLDLDLDLHRDARPTPERRRFKRPAADADKAAEIERRMAHRLAELEHDERELTQTANETAPTIREGSQRAAVMDRDALHRRLLALADMSAAAVALTAAILVGGGSPRIGVIATLPLIVLVAKVLGLYDRDQHVLHKATLEEVPGLLNVVLVTVLLAWLLNRVLSTGVITKPSLLVLAGIQVVAMSVTRSVARRVALHMTPPERILVLGTGEETARIREKLCAVSPVKAEVVGRVPVVYEPRRERSDEVLGILPELDYVLRRHGIDRVVICPHDERSSEMLDTVRLVKALGAKVSVFPRLFEVIGSSVEIDELGGLTLLGLRQSKLTKSSMILKRGFDVSAAAAGLFVLAPLLGAIALAIKITSPGPVFFRQRRVGRGGGAFDMLKFRTMYDGADGHKKHLVHRNEANGFFKIADDPRVTPIGRWLRRTSLDELPQLINVLRGEMSLVGPRPLIGEEDAQIEGWFRRRLDVTPGMTGAWQVLGSSRIPLSDMITIDYLYRTNWSLWLDVKILLRTVPHVLNRRGL